MRRRPLVPGREGLSLEAAPLVCAPEAVQQSVNWWLRAWRGWSLLLEFLLEARERAIQLLVQHLDLRPANTRGGLAGIVAGDVEIQSATLVSRLLCGNCQVP